MFVLGIQGSPRKNGNSDYLLSSFLKECESLGAKTKILHTPDMDIQPCKELIVCEKKGFCPLKDDMKTHGYHLVKAADVVVLASPVFFYNVSAQVKTFIDRCQMFWGRKYKLRLKDPARFTRKGFLLSVAASGGKRLFEGVDLTATYFFDAISAEFSGSLTYKKVEDAGDIIVRPELEREIRDAVSHILVPETEKKRLIFVSAEGRCRSPMAAAFAREQTRGRIRIEAAGLEGADAPLPDAVKTMAKKGLDIEYGNITAWDDLTDGIGEKDRLIYLGEDREYIPDRLKNAEKWDIIPFDADGGDEKIDAIRDLIQDKVRSI